MIRPRSPVTRALVAALEKLPAGEMLSASLLGEQIGVEVTSANSYSARNIVTRERGYTFAFRSGFLIRLNDTSTVKNRLPARRKRIYRQTTKGLREARGVDDRTLPAPLRREYQAATGALGAVRAAISAANGEHKFTHKK